MGRVVVSGGGEVCVDCDGEEDKSDSRLGRTVATGFLFWITGFLFWIYYHIAL